MANKKFSEFTTQTDTANVQFVVGFNGSDNVKITPANLTGGGGGASDLNGLSDCLVTAQFSQFIGNVPPSVTSGSAYNNTSLGHNTFENLTGGGNNTMLGFEAGYALTTNNDNTVIGSQALRSSNPAKVVAVGRFAGNASSGNNTVLVGYQAGRVNTNSGHVSVGYQAGYSQTSGADNTNVGYEAGRSNTTGGQRTCIGYRAGKANTGVSNTFIGRSAGSVSSTGSNNVVVGSNCMAFAAIGTQNVAIGVQAAQSATGNYNAIVGMQAGQYMTSAANSTLLGFEAGRNITTSPDNTFIGYQSGVNYNNTSGDGRNVGVGSTSGGALTTGIYNTFLGYGAGNGGGGTSATVTTGNFNTMVGYQAKGSSTAASNQNTFGYSAACSGNNQVTLGNSSIGTLRCQVTSITALSDERDKTNIEAIPYGLDFVNSLQPKKFVWDNRAETDGDGNEFFSANKGKKDIGFIAQDLQGVDDDYLSLVFDENPDKLEATYGRLIPVLVKAIQDLSAKVTALENA